MYLKCKLCTYLYIIFVFTFVYFSCFRTQLNSAAHHTPIKQKRCISVWIRCISGIHTCGRDLGIEEKCEWVARWSFIAAAVHRQLKGLPLIFIHCPSICHTVLQYRVKPHTHTHTHKHTHKHTRTLTYSGGHQDTITSHVDTITSQVDTKKFSPTLYRYTHKSCCKPRHHNMEWRQKNIFKDFVLNSRPHPPQGFHEISIWCCNKTAFMCTIYMACYNTPYKLYTLLIC